MKGTYHETSPERETLARRLRSINKRLADHFAYLRAELNDLDPTEADIRADSFYNSDPAHLQGALEELDSMRNTLSARIARIDSDLRRS